MKKYSYLIKLTEEEAMALRSFLGPHSTRSAAASVANLDDRGELGLFQLLQDTDVLCKVYHQLKQ